MPTTSETVSEEISMNYIFDIFTIQQRKKNWVFMTKAENNKKNK